MLPPLYDKSGALRLSLFQDDAREVLEEMTVWLREIGRGIYLPLDLMIVLLQRDHDELCQVIAGSTIGTVSPEDVLARLRELGREIEDHHNGAPSLERDAFSRSYARILDEAWEQASGRSEKITERDLLRAVMWRAEVTESASVRWAIKRLAEGGGDRLFDGRAQLKREAFDDVAWGFMHAAMQLAARSGTPFLGTPHLIAALCSVKDSVMWRGAVSRGLDPGRLREELLRIIGVKPGPLPDFILGRKTLTPRMVRMLSHARSQACKRGGEEAQIGETALVEAFLHDGGSSLELVQALGLEAEVVKALGEPKVLQGALDLEQAVSVSAVWEAAPPTPTLDLIGRDLTRQAREGKLPRIIGRERELQRVINVLLRKEQRNPLLKGEAGVGKTALAMALAQRIAEGRVPKPLLGQRVVEINGASLMSGTSYRGELESRIKNLLQEAGRGVILFIDEAHAVFAPRTSSHGPAEIPNHFKSALASGEIAVVAATTEAEYRRWMEQDPALKRRFEGIEIGEPNTELTMRILRDLSTDLEKDYEVEVSEEALLASMDYSVRYLPEQRLPDKAQKLLMDAAIAAAHPLGDEDEPVHRGPGPAKVLRAHVARQVSHRTGIPVDRLILKGEGWWKGVEERLRRHIVGQDRALTETARALVAGRLRPSATTRPLAVLVFFGAAGVGKGSLARALSAEVYGDPRAFLRLDMTDFSEAHTISRLIGSPPGYVGYEDEDMFVTPLRRRPSTVVLLEDIDKAHARVVERLLRVFDEGEIADTRGLMADARQAIFVLNVTTDARPRGAGGRIGFSDATAGRAQDSERLFEGDFPELYLRLRGHVDAFVYFEPFSADTERGIVEQLVERNLRSLTQRLLDEYNVELRWAPEVTAWILRRSAGRDANSVADLFREQIVQPVTHALLDGGAYHEGAVALEVQGDALRVCALQRVPALD